MVGESTAYGEPYAPKVSFARVAVRTLGGRLKGLPIRLVVLAAPGSDTEVQFWALYRELLLHPVRDAAVLVYAGINESDSQPPPSRSERWAARSLILSRWKYLRRVRSGAEPSWDYATRLERLLALARADGLPVAVSTLVGNVRDFAPDLEEAMDSPRLRGEYLAARALERGGMTSEASAAYEKILADPEAENDPGVRHRLAACLLRAGRASAAREEFRRAIDRGGTKRPTDEQNRAVRRLARETGAVLVDAQSLFEAAAPDALPGDDLFADAHHPNLKGVALLGEGFAEALSGLLGASLARGPLDEPALVREFALTREDLLKAAASRVEWFCGESSQRRDPEATIASARAALAAAEKVAGRKILPLRLLIALTARDVARARGYLRTPDAVLKDAAFLPALANRPSYVRGLGRGAKLDEDDERALARLLERARSVLDEEPGL